MTFPTTGVLDNFNRADEGPPPSASWVTPAWAPAGLKVDTNQLASNASNYGCTAGYNTVYGPDCEFYVDITAGTVDTTQFEIYARSDTNQLDNYFSAGNGYGLQVTVASGGSGGGLYLFKFVNGVTDDLSPVAVENFDLAVGDSFGIQVIGTTIKAFHKPAAGAWTEKISRTDATFGSAGYTGLMINDADGRLDNFGGGGYAPPSPPVANFSGTPLTIQTGDSVTFTDSSTNTPTSWSWDFGDGGSDTVQNPVHQYNTAGTYTVALTATNAGGSDTETKTSYVTVVDPPADPTLLVATAVAYNQIDLRWVDNASDESGFGIERSDNGTTGWAEIDTVAADVVTYSDTTVTAGQTKYYRVRAYKIV